MIDSMIQTTTPMIEIGTTEISMGTTEVLKGTTEVLVEIDTEMTMPKCVLESN